MGCGPKVGKNLEGSGAAVCRDRYAGGEKPKGRVGVAEQGLVSTRDGVGVAAGRGGQGRLKPATIRRHPHPLGNLERP